MGSWARRCAHRRRKNEGPEFWSGPPVRKDSQIGRSEFVTDAQKHRMGRDLDVGIKTCVWRRGERIGDMTEIGKAIFGAAKPIIAPKCPLDAATYGPARLERGCRATHR